MVCVSVCRDKTLSEKYLEITSDVALMASEDDKTVGGVAFDASGDTAVITALKYDDEFICELLLRAVANYAERRGIATILSQITEPSRVLTAVGFRLIDGQMTVATGNVVHICKSCADSGE